MQAAAMPPQQFAELWRAYTNELATCLVLQDTGRMVRGCHTALQLQSAAVHFACGFMTHCYIA